MPSRYGGAARLARPYGRLMIATTSHHGQLWPYSRRLDVEQCNGRLDVGVSLWMGAPLRPGEVSLEPEA
jgi:hypothetical protein